jgi:hypothetical protein
MKPTEAKDVFAIHAEADAISAKAFAHAHRAFRNDSAEAFGEAMSGLRDLITSLLTVADAARVEANKSASNAASIGSETAQPVLDAVAKFIAMTDEKKNSRANNERRDHFNYLDLVDFAYRDLVDAFAKYKAASASPAAIEPESTNSSPSIGAPPA